MVIKSIRPVVSEPIQCKETNNHLYSSIDIDNEEYLLSRFNTTAWSTFVDHAGSELNVLCSLMQTLPPTNVYCRLKNIRECLIPQSDVCLTDV